MVPIFLVVGLINILANMNNFNIPDDPELRNIRVRRDGIPASYYTERSIKSILQGDHYRRRAKRAYYNSSLNNQSYKYADTPTTTPHYGQNNNYPYGYTTTYNTGQNTGYNQIYNGYNSYYGSGGRQQQNPTPYYDTNNRWQYNPYNIPPKDYNQPQPGYNQQQPGYNQQQQGYNHQQPGYNQQQPGYNRQQSAQSNVADNIGIDTLIPVTNRTILNVTAETTTPAIACIICNIECPAFMKNIGLFCVKDKQENTEDEDYF